jgi:LysM repeat protein
MKTGRKVAMVVAGVPVVAGLCLLQGCKTSEVAVAKPEPVPLPPPPVVMVKPVEKPLPPPVAKPVEKPKLKTVAPQTTAYNVKTGESLGDIAYKYSLRWQDVLAVNPELTLKSKLHKGQTVMLPGQVDLAKARALPKKVVKKPAAPKPVEATAALPGVTPPATAENAYTVASGDSVYTIAAKHRVKRADLMQANNLTEKSVLQIGQKLVIPVKGEAVPAGMPAGVTPPPPEGGVTPPPMPGGPETLPAPAPAPLPAPPAGGAVAPAPAPAPAPGAVIPAPAPLPEPAGAVKTQNYTVKEGEDLYTVAIRWGVSASELKALNNLTSVDLQPGQVLKIPVAPATP